MTVQEAKDTIMPHGQHAGKRLAQIPAWHLRWMAKTWNSGRIKEAALMVVNERIVEVGGKLPYKPKVKELPLFKIKKPRPEFKMEAFGSLKEELENAPDGLF